VKIGLVLEHFDPKRGGQEYWTWQFAGRLSELGHEVHIIACDFKMPEGGPAMVLHQVKPSTSPLMRAASMERIIRSLALDVVHDMGAGVHADIFHAHSGSTVAGYEQSLKRIPLWRQIRFWRPKRYREQSEIERRQHACEKSLIVAVSQMDRDFFHALHGVPENRTRRIYNGVDTERFSPQHGKGHREATRQILGCQDRETVFLLVGYDLRRKNAESAIRALSHVVSAGGSARLLIVGGKRPRPCEQLARKLRISDRVAMIQAVSDIRPYYAAADVYVHPTWYDPCSLTAIEALACGLPVITTSFNGASELLTQGENGFVIADPADPLALAEKMTVLLDPALRSAMGASARRLALDHTLERQTAEFLSLYREISRV
jgi:UDP-glucose:(heptosyl)LPS alpha-1,3-glucosyltransferase